MNAKCWQAVDQKISTQPFQSTSHPVVLVRYCHLSMCLSILPRWRLNCPFYGSMTGSRGFFLCVFLMCFTHAWANRYSLASLLIFVLSQCPVGKKLRAKQFIPQSSPSVSANNGELVLSPSPKTLYMRQPCLCLPSIEATLLCPAFGSWHMHKNVSWGCACADEIWILQCVLLCSRICPAQPGGDEQHPKESVLRPQKAHLGSCIPGNTVRNKEVRKACSELGRNTKQQSR